MDAATLLPLLGLLVAAGAAAGVIAGLLGVGGGIVLVPAFLYTFTRLGFDGPDLMQLCLGTSLATIIATSLRSVLKHRARGAVDTAILRGVAPGIVVGALAGVVLATILPTGALKLLFGGLVVLVGLWIAFGNPALKLSDSFPTGPLRAALSFMVGTLSTLMGIGGGSFGVPLMTLFGQPIHRAVATAAGFGLLIAVPSVAGFLLSPIAPAGRPPFTLGSVNLAAAAVVIAMTWATAPLGVALAHRLDAGLLRRVFGGFLLLVGGKMLWNILA